MDREWEKVRSFHKVFGHPIGKKPQMLSPDRIGPRCDWMREEIEEFIEAEDIPHQADAMIDLIYFALGTLVEMGVKPDSLFDIVQGANMKKIWADGRVKHREDGKVIKPPEWVDPHEQLVAEIKRKVTRAANRSFTQHDYRMVVAKPGKTLAAVMESLLLATNVDDDNATEIVNRISEMQIDPGSVQTLFKTNAIPYTVQKMTVNELGQSDLEAQLKSGLEQGEHFLLIVDGVACFGHAESERKHACLIEGVEPQGVVYLLDPGPGEFGLLEMECSLLFNKLKEEKAELWRVFQ